uniref:Uncharacterized protein n=1 Tax=Mirabilis himalaica TaxID=482968 RepID=A0A6M9TTE5_9CARY|nr:hypothetical protein [Mirabilis himalaica]QKN19363.1 hypothetical protein [Mirabilis himalaica]
MTSQEIAILQKCQNMLRPLSPHQQSSLCHLIISFIRLSPLMFSAYLFFDLIGLNPDLILLKVKGSFILHGLRAIFRLFGLEIPIFILVSIVGSSLHMQDPAGGQPAANPAAEQPSNVPSGASTSGWRSFEERVLLEPMPSSGEASVNQQPVIPELHPPLLDDNTRRAELATRLRTNWWGVTYRDDILHSFLDNQIKIEKHPEAALVEDGYSRQVIFEKRHKIRGFLFYPNGRALSEDAYAGYLTQILNLGTRQSVPYRRIMIALHNYDPFFECLFRGEETCFPLGER